MGEYNFKGDLGLGQYGESVVIKDLESLGGELISVCETYHYDFELRYKGKDLRYEVKTDDYCLIHNDTGNIFIEFECRGSLSGISVTESDWFVYYYIHLGELWYIRTSILRELIRDNEFKISINSGDSGSETKGYLINRYQYREKFKTRKVSKENWGIYNKLRE